MSHKILGGKIKNKTPQERAIYDTYYTPPQVVKLLLQKEKFPGVIWECACGKGHISNVLSNYGYQVYSTDIRTDKSIKGIGGIDFLKNKVSHPSIITNPPFSLAQEFIEHALSLKKVQKAAFLLRIAFLESIKRQRLFLNNPLKTVYIISNRLPHWNSHKQEWNRTGGQFGHAWFVFDKKYKGKPTLDWLTYNREEAL